VGALAALGGTRRQALWQVEALGRSGPLFQGVAPGTAADDASDDDSPLPEMTDAEEMTADYRGSAMSTGPHPMSFVRASLDARGITRAGDLKGVGDGRRVAVAGVVIVRQRPGTAKGFVFITLEDETGFANAIVTPSLFVRDRLIIVGTNALIIKGVVQNQEGVVSIKADGFEPVEGRPAAIDVSHDFH
jgi:error-prone DNA polymerase